MSENVDVNKARKLMDGIEEWMTDLVIEEFNFWNDIDRVSVICQNGRKQLIFKYEDQWFAIFTAVPSENMVRLSVKDKEQTINVPELEFFPAPRKQFKKSGERRAIIADVSQKRAVREAICLSRNMLEV